MTEFQYSGEASSPSERFITVTLRSENFFILFLFFGINFTPMYPYPELHIPNMDPTTEQIPNLGI